MSRKIKQGLLRQSSLLTAMLFALAANNAVATIATGASTASAANGGLYEKYSGNGELVFSVFDSTAKVSYNLDLGLDLNSFFINAQQDVGVQMFFPVTDANWTTFLSRVNSANLRWSVLGLDSTGGTTVGGVRLFRTAQQGTELTVTSAYTNSDFTAVTGGTQMGKFLGALNGTGSHVTTNPPANIFVNGSSVNADADKNSSYYGDNSPGFSSLLNGHGSPDYDASNAVGASSWFYYVTRGTRPDPDTPGLFLNDGLAFTTVDEFDNLGHDGYWGFTKVGSNVDSPYKGQYLLSYTIEAYTPTAVTAAGQLRANFLDYAAGFQSRPVLNAALGEFAGFQVTSLVVPSAVPEPATWGLFGLGLLGLAWKARRRV